MLERLIMDKVQLQHARDRMFGMRIDDSQLEQALQRIAANNKMSLSQFRDALQKDGIPFAKFREDIREEMTIARVREREVNDKIVISEGEIDNYLSGDQTGASSSEEYEVAHILLRSRRSRRVRSRSRSCGQRPSRSMSACKRARLLAELAASYSDAPDALKGGSLGAGANSTACRPVRRGCRQAQGRAKWAHCCAVRTASTSSNCINKRGGSAPAPSSRRTSGIS
jgi:peptidyl-prolyl cis-trans isomerase SurA